MTARRSPIGRARGHGSAKEGALHWWNQRLTSIALVPLSIWFVASMVAMVGASQPEVAEWMSSRRTAVMMSLVLVTLFFHLKQGMQVIIEDYIEHQVIRLATLVLITFSCIALAFIGVVSVLRLANVG